MNKNDYINELDSLEADETLKNKIGKLQNAAPKKEKKQALKILLAVACICLVFFAGINILTFSGANKSAGSYADLATEENAYSYSAKGNGSSGTAGKYTQGRKVVKTASLSLETENYSSFMTAFEQKLGQYGAYITYLSADTGSDNSKSAHISVMVPSEKLDDFLDEMDSIATVGSKSIGTNDITNDYTDVENKIKALETEEKALLSILEKADKLDDIIKIQDRLSDVRSSLDSNKAQMKNYDEQIACSKTDIYVCEVGRVTAKSNGSFSQEVKTKFVNSLYNLGNAFKNIAVFVLGASPYLVLIAVVAVVVILIVKAKKKKRNNR